MTRRLMNGKFSSHSTGMIFFIKIEPENLNWGAHPPGAFAPFSPFKRRFDGS